MWDISYKRSVCESYPLLMSLLSLLDFQTPHRDGSLQTRGTYTLYLEDLEAIFKNYITSCSFEKFTHRCCINIWFHSEYLSNN